MTDRITADELRRMGYRLSRVGARVGNWNDRHSHSRHDSRSEASLRWRLLDRLSSWLYVLPDRVTRRERAAWRAPARAEKPRR